MKVTESPAELLEAFFVDLKVRDVSPKSQESYMSCLRNYVAFLEREGVDIVQVDRGILRDFISYLREERKVKAKTVQYYFTALNALYKFLLWERLITHNHIPEIIERYVRKYKKHDPPVERQILSVEQMAALMHSILNPRDRAVVMLLAKTGIRRDELVSLDVDDVDRTNMSIRLKEHRKRTNHTVFFDDEANRTLNAWLVAREEAGHPPESGPLFINQMGNRLQRNGVYTIVTKWARIAGYHDPKSERVQDHFSPHCCRHWFTTHLNRAEMKREYIAWLRGDADKETQDIYNHIDPILVREEYLLKMPQLGL